MNHFRSAASSPGHPPLPPALPIVYEVPPPSLPSPPPLPPPARLRTPSSGRGLKLLGLFAFCLTFVAIGAFVLPRSSSAAPEEPVKENASADPAPTRSDPLSDELKFSSIEPLENREAITDPTLLRRPDYIAPAVATPSRAEGVASLSAVIDRELGAALENAGVPASPLADDAEFLRRVHLDLTGNVPTREQVVAFLERKDPHKRSQLIDELLASEGYGRNLGRVWRDLLVKRDLDNNKGLQTEGFSNWLGDRFNRNEKWDQIVQAMLTAEGKEADNPAGFFILANQDNNQANPAKLVGAVGNLFLGIQLQCAECHVHPHNSKWEQDDFWGMAAFFSNVRIEREGGAKNKNRGAASVVERDRPGNRAAGPRKTPRANQPPAGPTIAIPDPTNPRRTIRTVRAKFFEGSRPKMEARGPYRPALARWVTSPDNRYFAHAFVNRLWAHFFARGFVNPLDDMSQDNAPSHPKLLEHLAGEFRRSGFDVKFLVRAICNTNAYQRTSRPLSGNTSDEKLFSRMPVKVLDAEVLLDVLATATKQKPARGAVLQRLRRGGGGPVAFFDTREYGDDPTEYTYGIPQVLRLMNTNLTNAGNGVIPALIKDDKRPEKVIEGLFLTALARRPSSAETDRMTQYVTKQSDPAKGYAGVFWALLNSAEFACNR